MTPSLDHFCKKAEKTILGFGADATGRCPVDRRQIPMSEPNAVSLAANAIQDGRLRSFLSSADGFDDDAVLTSLRVAVARIDATVATERERLGDAFKGAGVSTGTIDATTSDRPLIVIRAGIDPSEADAAVVAAEHMGYRRLAPTAPGAWRAYRRMYGRCELIHREHGERRIELSWRSGRNHTGALARVLVPDRSDFDAVTLGEAWWFGYVGVHLLRLPKRLWVRRSETARLGHFFVTPSSLVEPLLRFADAGPDELVVDLGCGDGRILVGAAQIGCRARGVESNPTLVDLARAAVSAAGVEDRVDVVHGDATNANLDDADVVVMFFPVGTLRELIPNVLSRLRPGARLIVHEQQRLLTTVSPDRSAPIASPAGVTVAHRWVR